MSHREDDRRGGKAERRVKLRDVVNFPVILSLLFVLQFVPFEHIPCLFGHNPVQTMDCHRGMADGVQMLPAQDTGLVACCGESFSVTFMIPRHEAKRIVSPTGTDSDELASSAIPPVLSRPPAWPPGALSLARSVDRTIVFSSLLI